MVSVLFVSDISEFIKKVQEHQLQESQKGEREEK